VQKKARNSSFTNLDKVFWPQEGYTKGDVLQYYDDISFWMLPYLKNRPMILHRQPEGIKDKGFFQKNINYELPSWIKTVEIQHEGKKVNYILVNDKKTLLYVANLGCIEMNPFCSRVDHLDTPDYFVLDLDPEKTPFKNVIETAQAAHDFLREIALDSYCKTSGARGLHLYIPLGKKYNYKQIEKLGTLIAYFIHRKLPKITSLERLPSKRIGKVYLDVLQNRPHQSVVAPYSLRPRPKAPVSAPLDWKEINPRLDPTEFNIKTMLKRVKKKQDLFKPILGRGVDLKKTLRLLEKYLP